MVFQLHDRGKLLAIITEKVFSGDNIEISIFLKARHHVGLLIGAARAMN